jgi:hypothetical protein
MFGSWGLKSFRPSTLILWYDATRIGQGGPSPLSEALSGAGITTSRDRSWYRGDHSAGTSPVAHHEPVHDLWSTQPLDRSIPALPRGPVGTPFKKIRFSMTANSMCSRVPKDDTGPPTVVYGTGTLSEKSRQVESKNPITRNWFQHAELYGPFVKIPETLLYLNRMRCPIVRNPPNSKFVGVRLQPS